MVPKGSIVELGYSDTGCRTYMAIAGGIESPYILSSRSMYKGLGQEKLMAGQELNTGMPGERSRGMMKQMPASVLGVAKWGSIELLEHHDTDLIRVTRGPEWHLFSPGSRRTWLNSHYKISNSSDRMGILLEGEALSVSEKEEMISTAVCTGTVQVIPDGSPLVLMADAQTTGGYPRIAQVIEADISLLAQKRPGDSIRFREVSNLVAEELYINRRKELEGLERSLKVKFSI
jgi:antagonist of KipI